MTQAPICECCWSEILLQRPDCCPRCGEDLFSAPNASGVIEPCRTCRLAPPPFVRAVSYGVYEGAMRGAIHALKYERISTAAPELGKRLAEAIAQMAPGEPYSANSAPDAMLVVPVPLHRGRLAQRGFNQARVLCVEALRILKRSHPRWRLELSSASLVRQRATDAQAGLTPRERRQNLRGAFFVSDSEAVQGRHILLVDDILTTGATARACGQTLLEAGAASIRVATLARAQRRFPLPGADSRENENIAGLESFAPHGATALPTETVH